MFARLIEACREASERHDHAASEAVLKSWIVANPSIDRHFFSKIAGVTHRNPDGRSRQKILRRCKPHEFLKLVPEPSNPVDPHAIAVLRMSGEQLGYLEKRLAGETYSRLAKGERWQALLSAVTGDDILGANILMFRIKP